MNDHHTPLPTSDDLEPQLESAVWAVLSEPLDAEAVERVKSRAFTLANEPSQVSPRVASSRGWLKMSVLAASVLLVVAATMTLPSTSSAFAQAVEKLQQVGSLRFKEYVYLASQDKPVEVMVLVAEDGRERRSTLDQVTIRDSSGLARITLNESTKTATVFRTTSDTEAVPRSQTAWLDHLKSFRQSPDKQLGKMTIDGHDCEGFQVKLAQADYAIWIDVATHDLVQVEFLGMPKGSNVTKSVTKEFEFNVQLDPALFSFEAPQGYTSSPVNLPQLISFEDSLLEALKGYTEASGGKFPKSISDWGEWAVLLAESDLPSQMRTDIAGRLGSLMPYLTSMPNTDYEYIGSGKTIDGKRLIVFWYINPEKQLRAVFSDLTVATITKEDLKAQ